MQRTLYNNTAPVNLFLSDPLEYFSVVKSEEMDCVYVLLLTVNHNPLT